MTHAPFGAAWLETKLTRRESETSTGGTASGATVTWRGGGVRRRRSACGTENRNPFPRMVATNLLQATGGGADRNSAPLYYFCHGRWNAIAG